MVSIRKQIIEQLQSNSQSQTLEWFSPPSPEFLIWGHSSKNKTQHPLVLVDVSLHGWLSIFGPTLSDTDAPFVLRPGVL